jgi:hypothetical protein
MRCLRRVKHYYIDSCLRLWLKGQGYFYLKTLARESSTGGASLRHASRQGSGAVV